MKRILVLLFTMAMLVPPWASAQAIKKDDKVADTKFMVITTALVAATIFDVETTFAAINNPRVHVRVTNPIMRPLFNTGRPATYAFLGGVDTVIVYHSYRMKKSTNPTSRKLWWVMPVTAITTHAAAGGFNLRFVFR